MSEAPAVVGEADLHAHSTVSDGTEAPAVLMAQAAAAGLWGVALTDHDSTSGWAEAAAAVP
jgi:3',5'-nucleoside bisphosphate phosphatase